MDTSFFKLSEGASGLGYKNNYISYLNSLHNLSADGSNALAESQALNKFFTGLYVPIPLTNEISKSLVKNEDTVVMLTGHAGDGKSTVSLDIFKQLTNCATDQPLENKIKELEEIKIANKDVSIVKDMSELSANTRLENLNSAFANSGSWLIVSNTGPLLDSLSEYFNNNLSVDIESEILKKLDIPYQNGKLDDHILENKNLEKKLLIINMTQLNNIDLGAQVLKNMLQHQGWGKCEKCDLTSSCQLYKNRNVLMDSEGVIEKVRWIYQRLTAYEKRLTLRQIVAHLSLSLTGGKNCADVRQEALHQNSTDNGLANILFSESFFGYKEGKKWENAQNLSAIKLIQRLEFGSPISVSFERNMIAPDSTHWVSLSKTLKTVEGNWRKKSRNTEGINWRFALRRMAYFYGQPCLTGSDKDWDVFLDRFLQTPKLRQFDEWQKNKQFNLSPTKKRKLKMEILQVLLEVYSGFSAGQFKDTRGRLFLTLKRPDRSVVQATQLVVTSLYYDDFSIEYDNARCLPYLSYRNNSAKLMLALPLLDYIHVRSNGNLGNHLAPLHLTQLEWFRSDLLRMSQNNQEDGEITLLRAGIDGVVKTYRYYLDDDKLESAL